MIYYEILGIDAHADKQEIKNSYFLKLRQFPAEVYPEQFQKIQEAYQILSDDKKRADYDTNELYGEKITALKAQALEDFDNNNFHTAMPLFKEILSYLPNDGSTLNFCGLTSFELGDIQQSIEYWQQAIAVNDSNATYHYNLGTGYEELEEYTKAIRCHKQAILCNPLEYSIIKHVSSLYIYLKDYENAWNIVERTMKKPVIRGELKIVFTKRLLEVAILIEGQFEMKLALKYADRFIEENPELKNSLLVEYYNFALKLAREKNYKWSLQVMEYVKKLDPTDQQIRDIYQEIKENYQIYGEFDRLMDDDEIPKEFTLRIYAYLYPDDVEEQELDDANDHIYDLCIDYPSVARNGIRRLKREYPAITNDMHKWIGAIESLL